MDVGILVAESWLYLATEYIAIDKTPLWPGIHVHGGSGSACRDLSAGHAKLKRLHPFFG